MINGAHVIVYSKDAEADRAFFKDVLGFPHVDAGHDRHSRRFLFVGCDMPDGHQFLDVFPIRYYESFEAELVAQNIGQDMMIDVAGNAVDFGRVDHHCVSARFDGGVEGRQEIFAQIIFGNPRRSAIAAAEWKAVTHVMFQAGGDTILGRDVCSFESTYEGDAHDLSKIRIFAERFVEARPKRLSPDIKHW